MEHSKVKCAMKWDLRSAMYRDQRMFTTRETDVTRLSRHTDDFRISGKDDKVGGKDRSFSEQGENDTMGEVQQVPGTYCGREIVSGWGNFVILRGVEKINEMEMDFGELRGIYNRGRRKRVTPMP
jgi:hypothetical protein